MFLLLHWFRYGKRIWKIISGEWPFYCPRNVLLISGKFWRHFCLQCRKNFTEKGEIFEFEHIYEQIAMRISLKNCGCRPSKARPIITNIRSFMETLKSKCYFLSSFYYHSKYDPFLFKNNFPIFFLRLKIAEFLASFLLI